MHADLTRHVEALERHDRRVRARLADRQRRYLALVLAPVVERVRQTPSQEAAEAVLREHFEGWAHRGR